MDCFAALAMTGETSVRRKTIKQAVAAGALEVGLRAAAVRSARRMRAVPGFRRIVVAQSDAVGMAHNRRTLRAARPVLADAVVAGRERGTVCFVRPLAACSSATSLAITTPFEFFHGPLPMRSRAFAAGAPSAACVER